MKLAHRILLKLIALLMVVGGATVAAMWWDAPFRAMLLGQFRLHVWTQYGFAFGLVPVLVGLIGLLPSGRRRAHNVISFPGVHGDVTIELDSVESTLTRMVNKMPEVKKIRIRVVPAEDRRRVRVKADVLVYKGASPSSARDLANRITDYLTDTAVNMLGVEDVTTVDLNVRGIVVDARPVPPPKIDERAPKPEEPVVEAPKPVLEEAPPAAIAVEPPSAEPAIPPVVETPVAAPVCEICAPAPVVADPFAVAEPEPVPSAHTLEDAWDISEPQDTPAHTAGSTSTPNDNKLLIVPTDEFVSQYRPLTSAEKGELGFADTSVENKVAVEAEPIAETAEPALATPNVTTKSPLTSDLVELPPLPAQ
ncbi:MAG: alkaline shock response membrane anchor protein AmaP, partial [Candidatus Hydrogenedentes bacterium]|nr:alkaline shock response membrane anchor protein AmaP [Candidatus Hydrogenedentota bacterium]